MGRPRILSIPLSLLQGETKAGTGLGGTTHPGPCSGAGPLHILCPAQGHPANGRLGVTSHPCSAWHTAYLGRREAFCVWSSQRHRLLLLVLPKRTPFSYWLSQKGGRFLLAVTEKAPFTIGPLRDGGFCSTRSYLVS